MTPEDLPRFTDLGLSTPVLSALERIGYTQPTPIQAESIPPLLAGRDLLGTAQTGTGKTAAFALPLLSRLDPMQRLPQVLVLAPTRELALQVAEAFRGYAAAMGGFRVLPIYGGQSMGDQMRELRRQPQVIVGTPGRIMDHLRRGSLSLEALRTVVLDEADEMLRMGFIDDVRWILEHTPEQRQVALFSATMPAQIRRVADEHLRDPAQVAIDARTTTAENVEQQVWMVAGASKLDAITRILSATEHDGVIVFVRTKHASENLAGRLVERGFAAAAINGDATQAQREATIARLKNGTIDVLVATDVAARGIDVARVSHVINYDMPMDAEAYVHRIGRTGRAGRAGTAILFVSARERRQLAVIERATGQRMSSLELPSKSQVERVRAARFKLELSRVLAEELLPPCERLLSEYLEEQPDADPQRVAAALLWMARRDRDAPLRSVPAPERDGAAERTPRVRHEPRHDGRSASAPQRSAPPASRGERPRRPAGDEADMPELEPYRIAVGRVHGVLPGDIVGAIANEAELDSRCIGRIRLHEDHSTVELPVGMPHEVLQVLRRARIRNVPTDMRRLGDASDAGADGGRDRPVDRARHGATAGPRRRAAGPQAGRPVRERVADSKPKRRTGPGAQAKAGAKPRRAGARQA